jgi:hypothetical protein
MTDVIVVIGAGLIGQAIVRRVSAGKRLICDRNGRVGENQLRAKLGGGRIAVVSVIGGGIWLGYLA